MIGHEAWCNSQIEGYDLGFTVKNLGASLKGWRGTLVLIAIFDKLKPGVLDVDASKSARDAKADPTRSIKEVVALFDSTFGVAPHLKPEHLTGALPPYSFYQTPTFCLLLMICVRKMTKTLFSRSVS